MKPANTTCFILAAGRGERMRPLTDHTPKPLLKVGQHRLIEHHLYRLASQGFQNIVINVAYMAQQIMDTLGDGSRYQLNIVYSDESDTGALETAGGIINAMKHIQSDPFLVINGDIRCDFNFNSLLTPLSQQARIVLVDNPAHHPSGDFALHNNLVMPKSADRSSVTYSGIGLYHKSLFSGLASGSHALGPLLKHAITNKQIEGLHHTGLWVDVGTPERLAQIANSE